MVEPVACLCEVTRRRGDALAVEDLSLEIGPAETVALLGPNGAGKTTTLELMLGLVRPDRGLVRVLGTAPGTAIARGAIGAMLQEGGLPARAGVAELVDLVRGLYPRPLALGDVLVLCDLGELAERRVEALSGGERQRVRLALAVAGGPELLVLDEPTAAMDVAARLSFWKRSADYVSGGRSLVFATHRLEEAEAVADRIVMLSRGRVVADASPEELKASIGVRARVGFFRDRVPLELVERLPAVDRVEVVEGRVTLQTFDPDRTLRALLELVPELDGLEVNGPRLEEAFLALTEGQSG
ncbi:MAG TPA: ABC transporter ATP-binding protein [Thermoleophilaceae bacterium]|nr:ABC transporter ATP-binding protein [Thermoleophilaceae bacterium]